MLDLAKWSIVDIRLIRLSADLYRQGFRPTLHITFLDGKQAPSKRKTILIIKHYYSHMCNLLFAHKSCTPTLQIIRTKISNIAVEKI